MFMYFFGKGKMEQKLFGN